jgi:soluble methane monooxygenase-binding protein MmoD
MENASYVLEEVELDGRPSSEHLLIKVAGRYTAYAIDLGFLWHWEIYMEENVMVQDGGSISLTSATEAINHVLSYFSARDQNTICGNGVAIE